jgi:ATP-binding protein involved in chromosome partitioning
MPPGTGDLPQTVIELLPVDGVVVVSTPHVLAVRDTIKGVEMLNKLGVPVSALVQNMSILACQECGSQNHPFGDTVERRLLELCGHAPSVHFPIVRDGGLG